MGYQGKHYRPEPMRRRTLGERVWGVWSQNKLLSRKWWLASAAVSAAIVLDVLGRTLQEPTLHFLEVVIPAYLLVEGALDWRYKRRRQPQEKESEGGDVI